MLSKEAIMTTVSCKVQELEVPEWGGTVYLRQISGAERDAFEASVMGNKLNNLRGRFAVLVLSDENGKRMFLDSEANSVGEKNGKALDRVFEAGRKFNGMTDDDVAELEKN
jgi:hypothetical protein